LRALKLLIGIVIGAVCLVLAFRGVANTEQQTGIAWGDIVTMMRGIAWWGPAGFVAFVFAQLVLRSERWRIQVRGLMGTAPGHRESVAINSVAAAAVFLLPFRLGELVRPNLSAQRNIMRASAGLAATALERAIDGIVTTFFFGVVLIALRNRSDVRLPAEVGVGGVIALVVFGGALVFFVAAFKWREGTARLVLRALSLVHGPFARRAASILTGFLDGLACFRRPRDMLAYVGLTLAYWLVNAVSVFIVMRAMGIAVDPLAALLCLCFLVMGMMIPAPPGNVGNFHVFARSALTVFAVAPTPAVAFAIVLHALTVLSVVLLGGFFLATGDVSLATIRAATKDLRSSD
jgi:uncharacterized protein (TIRG00374 family)